MSSRLRQRGRHGHWQDGELEIPGNLTKPRGHIWEKSCSHSMRSRAYVYLSRLSTAATDASGFAAEHPIDVKKRSNKDKNF